MAKTKEKKDSETPQAQAAEPAPAAEQAQAAGQAPAAEPPVPEEKQPSKPPKQSNLLLNILTVLLVLLGIGEAVLLGYVGFQAFRGRQARNLYLSQQAGLEQDDTQQLSGACYLGPRLQIENGEVVWRSEDNPLGGAGTGTASAQAGASGGDTQLSSLTVPQMPYRLAEEDEPTQT